MGVAEVGDRVAEIEGGVRRVREIEGGGRGLGGLREICAQVLLDNSFLRNEQYIICAVIFVVRVLQKNMLFRSTTSYDITNKLQITKN